MDTECRVEVRLPLGAGCILGRCERPPGHEGEHWVRMTRTTIRWAQEVTGD